jgi:hypothetical protein
MAGYLRRARTLGLAVAVLAAASLAFLVWQPFAAASAGCLVTNANQGGSFSDLQSAIDAASNGAVLQVQGTCTGTARTSIDLKIEGVSGDGSPTLDGGGQGTVLTIEANTRVVLNSLTITNGFTKPSTGAALVGSGVANEGNVTITDSTITANPVTQMTNDTGATMTLIDSVVSNGGGGIRNNGTVTLRGDSSITGNTATAFSPVGGGIANNRGTVTLDDTSSITDNAAFGGGGIFNQGGSVTLNDSTSIHDNTEDNPFNHTSAAGVASLHGGTFTMNGDSSVYDNSSVFH